MVQVLVDPASPMSHGHVTRFENAEYYKTSHGGHESMSREEHARRMKELLAKRSKRAPRRGWTMLDYPSTQADQAPTPHATYFHSQVSIPENSVVVSRPATPAATPIIEDDSVQLVQRPKLPPPRRSYSVTDREPLPANLPKPSHRLHLLDLPSELHYNIVDFLDPIDSACFGLAHPALYDIHRRKHGKIRLSARYQGPNDMEWAWRGAGSLKRAETTNLTSESELAHMRVQGQVYCRKCGVSRCELHRHLKSWMGVDKEYCSIRETFGKPAGEDAKPYCYLSSPKNPHRCGRHGGKKFA
ncbi:uncharacterized protein J7T54_006506 [Emericellopsis cladophorae]|uniref:F-box domain-containing protein n=1 Tax=Emericellopsis cladophorae TaxID=2686198 RepID=A0A9Q0BGY0_9HYPO|nr:uncharacterized protein J7T54_006506 [Emericellopsis cladophorae]KAI6784461.1 hypothetical protein J7T54_006506 [Emericellopsis cladophorae]